MGAGRNPVGIHRAIIVCRYTRIMSGNISTARKHTGSAVNTVIDSSVYSTVILVIPGK